MDVKAAGKKGSLAVRCWGELCGHLDPRKTRTWAPGHSRPDYQAGKVFGWDDAGKRGRPRGATESTEDPGETCAVGAGEVSKGPLV